MSLKISDLLAALNEAGVRYIVVGGVAVNLHGHSRFTKDLDLVFAMDPGNLASATATLSALGFQPLTPISLSDFADPALRARWAQEKSMVVLQLFDPAETTRRLDIFVQEPIPFAEMEKTRVTIELSGVPVHVCSLEHLIQMKSSVGRPQDLIDVEKLRAIQLLRMRGPG